MSYAHLYDLILLNKEKIKKTLPLIPAIDHKPTERNYKAWLIQLLEQNQINPVLISYMTGYIDSSIRNARFDLLSDPDNRSEQLNEIIIQLKQLNDLPNFLQLISIVSKSILLKDEESYGIFYSSTLLDLLQKGHDFLNRDYDDSLPSLIEKYTERANKIKGLIISYEELVNDLSQLDIKSSPSTPNSSRSNQTTPCSTSSVLSRLSLTPLTPATPVVFSSPLVDPSLATPESNGSNGPRSRWQLAELASPGDEPILPSSENEGSSRSHP